MTGTLGIGAEERHEGPVVVLERGGHTIKNSVMAPIDQKYLKKVRLPAALVHCTGELQKRELKKTKKSRLLRPAPTIKGCKTQSKYSFMRSKKPFSFLLGLGSKFLESRSCSNIFFSSLLRWVGVKMLISTSRSPRP